MGNRFKRVWRPNVQKTVLFSNILNREIEEKTSTWTLRSIDNCGGLDAFLLTTPIQKLKDSNVAVNLRNEIIEKLKIMHSEDTLKIQHISKLK